MSAAFWFEPQRGGRNAARYAAARRFLPPRRGLITFGTATVGLRPRLTSARPFGPQIRPATSCDQVTGDAPFFRVPHPSPDLSGFAWGCACGRRNGRPPLEKPPVPFASGLATASPQAGSKDAWGATQKNTLAMATRQPGCPPQARANSRRKSLMSSNAESPKGHIPFLAARPR